MVTAGPPHHILGALIWAPPAECYDYSATCWVLWLQRHLLSVMTTAPPAECYDYSATCWVLWLQRHLLSVMTTAPPVECYDYSATCWVLWLQRHLLSVMITAPPVECFVIQVWSYHRRNGSAGHIMNRITSLDARTASPCATGVAPTNVCVMRSMMTIVTRRNTTYARAEGRLVRCVKERMKTAPGTSRKAREQKTHRSSCSAPAAAFK